MGKDYTIRIEAKEYTFEFELKDPRLREIYDQDPKYVRDVLSDNILSSIGELRAVNMFELRRIFQKMNLELIVRKQAVLRGFKEKLESEHLH